MGIIAILVEVGFGIWGAVGKPWYWYPINVAALFFGTCAVLSLIIAVTSDEFRTAKLRTELFELTPDADKMLSDYEKEKRRV